MPPDTFGSFRVLHQIGVGTLGPVFRAQDPAQDRFVAIKAFRGDYTAEQVQALAAALVRLVENSVEHTAIIRPIAAGVQGAFPYLVEEFFVADSMDVAVREFGPAPLADALTRITQLAAALDLAATAGIRHGALHPRDVLVSAAETRLTGLGIAQAIESIGGHAPVRYPYTAPERASGGQSWGSAADVFSFAALAFELIYGRRVTGTGDAAIKDVPSIAGIDHEGLRAVMASALAEVPAHRPMSALAFVAALQEAVLDPGSTGAPAPALRRRERRQLVPQQTRSDGALPVDQEDAPQPTATPPFLRPGTIESRIPASARSEPAPVRPEDIDLRFDEGAEEAPAPPPLDRLDLSFEERETSDSAPEAERIGGPDDFSFAVLDAPRDELRPDMPAAAEPSLGPVSVAADPSQRPSALPAYEPFTMFRDQTPVRPPRRWPLAATMLIVGLLAGFAAGYGVGMRSPTGASGAAGASGATGVGATDAASTGAQGATGGVEAPGPAGAGQPSGGSAASPGAVPTTSAPVVQDRNPEAVPPAPATPASSERTDASRGERADAGRGVAPAPAAPIAPVLSGAVLVRSDPPGAQVLVDGQVSGVTPTAIRELPFGSHTIAVTLPGYGRREERVELSRGQPSRSLEFTLRRPGDGFYGELLIDSRPAGARVMIDGKESGVTPLSMPRLPAGSHVVRLDLDGYQPWSSAVRVVAGERTHVSGSLER